jgi:hypothetical protein
MENEHIVLLRQLRDDLVEERRQLVATGFVDPESRQEAAAVFVGIQNFIDTVERAISHEASLAQVGRLAPQLNG